MGYSRKNSKMGRRRMRKTFSKKKRLTRKRGGCGCSKQKGGTTQMPDLNKPIYDYATSVAPYRN